MIWVDRMREHRRLRASQVIHLMNEVGLAPDPWQRSVIRGMFPSRRPSLPVRRGSDGLRLAGSRKSDR